MLDQGAANINLTDRAHRHKPRHEAAKHLSSLAMSSRAAFRGICPAQTNSDAAHPDAEVQLIGIDHPADYVADLGRGSEALKPIRSGRYCGTTSSDAVQQPNLIGQLPKT